MKSAKSKGLSRDGSNTISKESQRQSKKRNRSNRFHGKRVIVTGEQPSERHLKNGKLRHLDLGAKGQENDQIPRKAREFMARMSKWKSGSSDRPVHEDQKRPADRVKAIRPSRDELSHQSWGGGMQPVDTNLTSEPRAQSKKPTESIAECTVRLRKESKQMAFDLARAGNHQREKRKAYHKKRRERLQRRKRRRRGECSDSEVEEDDNYDENTQRISHLPAYWQEIVKNNGRPLSAKKKRRINRLEREAEAKSTFGDQVDRPPDLTVQPVRRSNATAAKAV